MRADRKLKIPGVTGLENIEVSIKSVSHNLSTTNYIIDAEFDG